VAALVVLLAIVVGLFALLVVGLLRSHAEILRELHDLQHGTARAEQAAPPASAAVQGRAAPGVIDVVGTDPGGDSVHVGVVGARHRTLLAFLSSGCATCRTFWDELGHAELPRDIHPLIVTQGPEHESPSAIAALAPTNVSVVMSTEAWDSYDTPVVPYFMLVDGPTAQVVGEGAGATWDQVRRMMMQALGDDGMRRGGATGERDGRIDDELSAAGIGPGHPSLYPEAPVEEEIA
jgi:hypothetical protein